MDIESMSLDELIATQNDELPLCEPFGFTCDYVIDEPIYLENKNYLEKLYFGLLDKKTVAGRLINNNHITDLIFFKELHGFSNEYLARLNGVSTARISKETKEQINTIKNYSTYHLGIKS